MTILNIILLLSIVLPLTAVANRLRGTGLLYHFGTIRNLNKYTFNKVDEVRINLVWNHMYGLYIALIVGYLTGSGLAGFLTFVCYIIGESKGWGEWVGTLSMQRKDINYTLLIKMLNEKEGTTFPFIYQIANFFIKEDIGPDVGFEERLSNYLRHAKLALALRGIYWWSLVLLIPYIYDLISLIEYVSLFVFAGLVFPIAACLGRKTNYSGKISVINYSVGWENQELYNGMFHGMILSYIIINNCI